VQYYAQAIDGQFELFRRSQPIPQLLADPALQAPLRLKLSEVLAIRQFATEQLHLPDNDSYTHYADLQRPYVVWSVFATPPFSLTPKTWCFPIVGCVSYRGYFAEADANALAESLTAEGYEVYVAGVAAYSTLGWFADPVLNTMLEWPLPRLAGLIFHELAHQQLYVANATAFNEAFAMAVEYEGVERWLAQRNDPEMTAHYNRLQGYRQDFIDLVLATRDQLEALYVQPLPIATMQAQKQAILQQLQADYQRLKTTQWDGFAGYDHWFNNVNNAKLSAVVTYQAYVPAFQYLLAQHQGALPAFYQAVAALAALPPSEREQQLAALLAAAQH
jgi:predicted aminopeptidase